MYDSFERNPMPVLLTYDLEGAGPAEFNRLQSMFERLGWEKLGGSSYRYPRLGTTGQPVEDWLNHVVPALMLFRTFVIKSSSDLRQFTLDVQSSSGYQKSTNFGSAPLSGSDMKTATTKAKKSTAKAKKLDKKIYTPTNTSFGEKNLIEWLDEVEYPY
jgi:hypothetical protein